jgi:hypothetical protein
MESSTPDTRIDPKYSIGIPEMDAQHARWIQLIEKFRSVGSGHMLEQSGINAAAHALYSGPRFSDSGLSCTLSDEDMRNE